jgi:ribosomal protein L37AE/L43A
MRRRLGFRDERKWAAIRAAKKLGITVEVLESTIRHLAEVAERQRNRDYCESCGRKVRDDNLDEPEILPHGMDEEGLTICDDCGERLSEEAAQPEETPP